MDNRWSDSLRQKMEAHSEAPPEGLWEAVERGMDRRAQDLSRRRRNMLWSVCSGAAAAVVAVLFLVIGDGAMTGDPAGDGVVSPLAGDHRPVVSGPADDRVADSVSDSVTVPNIGRADGPATVLLPVASVDTPRTIPVPETLPEITPEATPEPEQEPRREQPREQRPANDYERYFATHDPAPAPTPARKSRRSGRWMAGLYASNSSFAGSRSEMGVGGLIAQNNMFYDLTNRVSEITDASNGLLYGSVPPPPPRFTIYPDSFRQSVYNDVKHRLPVTVGLSVGYGLGERWSITSGVTYTRLSSTFRTVSGPSSSTYEQILHYVGIPLDVKFDLWRSTGGVSVYLSAGGQAAKNVSGRLTHSGTSIYLNSGSTDGTISDPHLQWSVRGSAGVGYDFTPAVGLYAEPGVDYHFDNGSGVVTVWKDRPLNFGLRLGLRLSL